MAQSKAAAAKAKSADGDDQFEKVVAEGAGVTVTNETPAEADETSVNNAMDAKANDPPVRTNRPDVPIAQVLASGAGEHMPVDDPHIGADGRFYADEDEAAATKGSV
jgi:hypothetical protein